MTDQTTIIQGGPIFDGVTLHAGKAARFVNGKLLDLMDSATKGPHPAEVIDLQGDILSAGFVDLQVNGGGGVMFNDDPSVETLKCISEAHRQLGTTALFPTLITDTKDATRAAIAAVKAAVQQNVPGIIGLHLEGPHLSVARKGAHSEDLIRPMEQRDLEILLDAARQVPNLMVTIAPENVTRDQVSALAKSGVIVSLGHTDADYETCAAFARAGASCATHLFNAMSQMGNRQPGLVGTALDLGSMSAGLIADGIHVHTATIRAAWNAKTRPGQLFLVSDAMAVAGTELRSFTLNGRTIHRENGQLRLENGTLAGADLDLATAVSVLVNDCRVERAHALAAATSTPARIAKLKSYNLKDSGVSLTDIIRISEDLRHATPVLAA